MNSMLLYRINSYEFNASVSAIVINNNNESTSGAISAFVNDETRGISRSDEEN